MADAKDMEKLGIRLNAEGGFVRVPFCSDNKDGEPCADKIKEAHSGNVRGTRFGVNEKPAEGEVCISCGKPATIYEYVAKQY